MYYLADFKRRYEKWLDDQPNNKSILIPELNTANKNRKVSEAKTVIKNARKTNLKKGRNKSTKTYIDSQKRLRKYTGGNLGTTSLAPRQKRIQELAIKNKENYLRKQANKVLTPSDRPIVSLPKNSELKTPKQEASKIVKYDPPTKEMTTIKNPQISEPKSSSIKKVITVKHTKKISNRIGRKVLTGLGVTALGMGALYGLNRLRKTRQDKGKIRGKYKR